MESKDNMLIEVDEYVEDIKKYLKEDDYSSAQRMVSGLRNAISLWKKWK